MERGSRGRHTKLVTLLTLKVSSSKLAGRLTNRSEASNLHELRPCPQRGRKVITTCLKETQLPGNWWDHPGINLP
jgi:hypothetical protein